MKIAIVSLISTVFWMYGIVTGAPPLGLIIPISGLVLFVFVIRPAIIAKEKQ